MNDFMEKYKDRIFYPEGEGSTLSKYGLQIKDGWLDLIDRCAAEICEIDKSGKIRFSQIKEKFGGLRFYTDNSLADMELWLKVREVISKYEKESYSICEICGNPGEVRNTRKPTVTCIEHSDMGK
jgi:hypothetical protein